MKPVLKFYIFIAMLVCYASCRKSTLLSDDELEKLTLRRYITIPSEPFNYANPDLPAFFNDQFVRIQDNTPADNPVTDWGATLGRVLFYDTRLSKNNTISCASCHQQQFGFSDTAEFSVGFEGGLTQRHSMGLANARYYSNGRFFWDERAPTLEAQVLMPIADEVEMGLSLDSVTRRLRSTEFYPILFRYAFGTEEVSTERISKAMAQFIRSMVSYRSKYDEGRALAASRLDSFPNYTPEENLGKFIFMTNKNVNCFGCHNTDVLITDNPRNQGLHFGNADSGVFVHTQNPLDIGKFKAPSLKNVALRGRFMHDGSLKGLSEVLNHYNLDIQPNPNLDMHLRDVNGNPAIMNLSTDELKALEAFLKTLTDEKMIHDVKFSSPFH
jgi:cytochrome c peroxidase